MNNTTALPEEEGVGVTWDDATWILTSSFIIFTMQSGFGLLEAGAVSLKNEVNIMVKNVVDVVFGGLSYWVFGYGLSFGTSPGSNPFCGVGYWFVTSNRVEEMGVLYSSFIFQLSFTTTATTIVSGAMAERTKLSSYMVFSFLNTLIYCFPAHWVWGSNGFLATMGCVDIAGSGAVHLLGGASALMAAWMLKPRTGRYDNGPDPLPLGNPTNTLIGTFMLWWGWLAFNSGSTYGISEGKWKLAGKASVSTIMASMGGGFSGMVISYLRNKGKYDISDIANSVLGALVSITAGCAVIHPWEAVIVGFIGGALCCLFPLVLDRIKIDDPVGAVAVHGIGGIWGMLTVGLFAERDSIQDITRGRDALFKGGGFYLLGVQALACVCIIVWSMVTTWLLLYPIHKLLGIRMNEWEEKFGADFCEHNVIRDPTIGALIGQPMTDAEGTASRMRVRSAFGYSRTDSGRCYGNGKRKIRPAEDTVLNEIEAVSVLSVSTIGESVANNLNIPGVKFELAEIETISTVDVPSIGNPVTSK